MVGLGFSAWSHSAQAIICIRGVFIQSALWLGMKVVSLKFSECLIQKKKHKLEVHEDQRAAFFWHFVWNTFFLLDICPSASWYCSPCFTLWFSYALHVVLGC